MRERWKKVCRVLKRRLPSASRKGKVIRNFVFVLLTVVLFWWATGAPALTPQWRYRRAERANLIEGTEIKAVLETDWINCETHELVVGENEDSYFICLTDEAFYARYLQCYEKRGDVTLTGAPESFFPGYFDTAIPFLVLTELPAVKAELELVLPPELSWRWVNMEGHEAFAGAVCRGEDHNEDGVFTFSFPSGLVDVEPGANDPDLTDQMVMEWDALYILRETLQGIKQQKDYGCSVTAHIRLWDAQDQLIYNETLIYDIKG